jgi:MarR family transcriptional regulator, transcriptional regulator for hemolysin
MTYRLHASLGYHLSRAARVQERRLEEGLRTLGLTRTTWCILLAVGNESLVQPSEIAEFVGIDRTATSRALRAMEADGLISRAAGNDDGRTTAVRLTELGRAHLARGTPMAEANNAVMRARLTPAEAEELTRLLARLTEGEALLKTF